MARSGGDLRRGLVQEIIKVAVDSPSRRHTSDFTQENGQKEKVPRKKRYRESFRDLSRFSDPFNPRKSALGGVIKFLIPSPKAAAVLFSEGKVVGIIASFPVLYVPAQSVWLN